MEELLSSASFLWPFFPFSLSSQLNSAYSIFQGSICSDEVLLLPSLYTRFGMASYENTLKVEHQATTLSLYSVRLSLNQQRITEVKHARRLETHFRGPQLDLWQLSDTEWLLALRRPESSPRKKPVKLVPLAQELPLSIFGTTG
jgi:hypothetical protein